MAMPPMLKKSISYLVSFLGAAGTALQNYMAVAALIKDLLNASFAASKAGLGIIHGVAIGLGALCSGLVNFFINLELLESFWLRITTKPIPKLKGWKKFQYWAGCIVFVVTGILFGLTAFAFGPIGALAAISIAAGIFVAIIMTIQELETWLMSFDPKENEAETNVEPAPSSPNAGKIMGHVIALGNVLALSLLFAFGLATFLISIVGLPALPAVLIGFGFAFSFGAFTEFYFYNYFISSFCEKLQTMWIEFWNSKNSPLGLVASTINALVNGVLAYVGIMAITTLLTAASIALPPVGIIIAIAATAAVFAGLASFFLAIDFWKQKNKVEEPKPKAEGSDAFDTATIEQAVALSAKPANDHTHTPQLVLVSPGASISGDGQSATPSNAGFYKPKMDAAASKFEAPPQSQSWCQLL